MNNVTINTKPVVHKIVMCANVFIRKDVKYLVMQRSQKKKYVTGLIHPYGGKIDPDEDPYTGAIREVREEVGIEIKNVKLEAVILELHHRKDSPVNWLIFHFSADYASGEVKGSVEGEAKLLTPEELRNSKLFPSVKSIIENILDPDDGTVFTKNYYEGFESGMKEISKNICTK